MHTNNNRVSAAATTVLLAISLVVSPSIASVRISASSTVEASLPSNVHIDNFGRVNATYYRGAQPAGRDYADLRAAGVKTVIDLTEDGEAQEAATVQDLGMKFYRISMTTHETPSSEKIQQFLTIVNDPSNQPVYVHCQGGRHRTGVMTAIYRMSGEGWTADRAFAEMKQYKFGMDFLHQEFKDFIMTYEPARNRVPTAQTVAESKPSSEIATPTLAN